MKSIDLQKGSVMMEAAYVLPLMLVMILLLADIVVYVTDRLYANNVMADAYKLVMGEASMVSGTNPQANVLCTSGVVVLNKSALETTITDSFETIFPGLVAGEAGNIDYLLVGTDTGVVPSVNVITVRIPPRTILLPETLFKHFKLESKLILSLDLECKP